MADKPPCVVVKCQCGQRNRIMRADFEGDCRCGKCGGKIPTQHIYCEIITSAFTGGLTEFADWAAHGR